MSASYLQDEDYLSNYEGNDIVFCDFPCSSKLPNKVSHSNIQCVEKQGWKSANISECADYSKYSITDCY